LVYLYFFFLDAPIHLLITLLPFPVFNLSVVMPLIIFGVLGSLLWFLIPWLMDRLITRAFPNIARTMRWISVIGVIPLFMAGFIFLPPLTTSLAIIQQRPDELKKSLESTSSDFLTQRIVFDDTSLGGISSITRGSYRPDTGPETALAFHRGVVFLDDNYEEKNRIEFSDGSFTTVYPIHTADDSATRFITYKIFKYAALLDYNGNEMWRIVGTSDRGPYISGVQSGDINSDGKQEFAVYYQYQNGIMLIDESGKSLWEHPVYSLGHLEMKDVRGNGKEEIIYSNSNNANRRTVFKTLDSEGVIVDELEISTKSYEFVVIDWPAVEDRPNLLLTEENEIRVVDMTGNTVIHLEAPGCRAWGDVKAVTVKFQKDEPAFIAVRKILHPDLAVLYVYDANGALVFQSTQTVEGSMHASIASVPADEIGIEKLLVGTRYGYDEKVIEYSLAQQN
jgi:hypothetical protein